MSAGDWKDMYAAAVAGDAARVRYHVDAGVDPNHQHPEIMATPLVASLIHGHAEITRYLLEHGADPHLRSEADGLDPLEAARKHGRAESVELLRALGARERRRPFWRRWLPV